jgi:hypothetical protein
MTPLYIDHSHPKVKAIMDAQAILRLSMRALYQESHCLPIKAQRLKASKACGKVDRAMLALSEEIRHDANCWVAA